MSKRDEVIEAAMRGIWEAGGGLCRSHAASAVEAISNVLMQPNGEMILAGDRAAGDICGHWPDRAVDVFQAMLTEALKGDAA